jgi:hypothetical protein
MLAHSQVLIRQFLLVYIVELSGARAKVHGRLVMKNKHTAALRRVAGSKTKRRRINRWRNARAALAGEIRIRPSRHSTAHPIYTQSGRLFKTGIKRKRVIVSVSIIFLPFLTSHRRVEIVKTCLDGVMMMALYVRYVHSLLSLQKVMSLLNCILANRVVKGFAVAI